MVVLLPVVVLERENVDDAVCVTTRQAVLLGVPEAVGVLVTVAVEVAVLLLVAVAVAVCDGVCEEV